VTWGFPSERVLVATAEAFAPPPTVGLRVARSGGHSTAHPPVHVLFMPESFWNR
jgi:hypothetical protein